MERKFNYKYVVNEEKRIVVALSSFAGKVVRGVAKCSPNDPWDVEAGKKLAAARCNEKIAYKRWKRAETLVSYYSDAINWCNTQLDKYIKYESDSLEGFKKARVDLENLMKNM